MSATGMTYEQWYAKLDAMVQDRIGLRLSDLADAPYRDYYDPDASDAELREIMVEFAEQWWEWPADLFEVDA